MDYKDIWFAVRDGQADLSTVYTDHSEAMEATQARANKENAICSVVRYRQKGEQSREPEPGAVADAKKGKGKKAK